MGNFRGRKLLRKIQFSWRKLSQIATKTRNSRKFSPSKVSCYNYGNNTPCLCNHMYDTFMRSRCNSVSCSVGWHGWWGCSPGCFPSIGWKAKIPGQSYSAFCNDLALLPHHHTEVLIPSYIAMKCAFILQLMKSWVKVWEHYYHRVGRLYVGLVPMHT